MADFFNNQPPGGQPLQPGGFPQPLPAYNVQMANANSNIGFQVPQAGLGQPLPTGMVAPGQQQFFPSSGTSSVMPQPILVTSQKHHKSDKKDKKDKDKKDKIKKDKKRFIVPGVNCRVCGKASEKGLYHCLQCADYPVCQKCIKKGDHHHLFASVKSAEQLQKFRAGNAPILPINMELSSWYNSLDMQTKTALDERYRILNERCSNPQCNETGALFVCMECPTNTAICKSCEKDGFHCQHILAMTGMKDKKSDVSRKFLLHHQLIRNRL